MLNELFKNQKMNKQKTIDFNISSYEIQCRFYPAPNEFKEKLQNAFKLELRKSEERKGFNINRLVSSIELGYGGILLEANAEELNSVLTVLNENENYVKVMGVQDLNKTVAEIYNDNGVVKIRENYYNESQESATITPEEANELLNPGDRKLYESQNRVLFWIDKRKLNALIW